MPTHEINHQCPQSVGTEVNAKSFQSLQLSTISVEIQLHIIYSIM